MALEHSLHVNGSDCLEQSTKEIIKSKEGNFQEERPNAKALVLDTLNNVGFSIHILPKFKMIFEIGEKENQYKSSLTFRVDKEFDRLQMKRNMLNIVKEFLKKKELELILLFNGEEVILMKDYQNGIRINDTDFWKYEIKEVIKDVDYSEHNFDGL